MDIIQQMNLFHIGFSVCLVAMAAGFGLAVFFFIRFRIPKALALLKGTARGGGGAVLHYRMIEHTLVVHTEEFI